MKTRFQRTDRGFSLMELMVVIMILGILAVVVQKNIWPLIGKAKQNTARTNIKSLMESVNLYKLNNNKLPDSLDLLIQSDPKNNNAPYVEGEQVPIDPWGNPYDFKKDGSKFEIISYGADGAPNGDGEDEDITSKNLSNTKK